MRILPLRLRKRFRNRDEDASGPSSTDADSASEVSPSTDAGQRPAAMGQAGSSSSSPSSSSSSPFTPAPDDVHTVRYLFVKHLRLPLEIADMVLDAAQYHPVLTCSRDDALVVPSSAGRANSAAALCLLSDPIPAAQEAERVRVCSARFWVRSHDQGWGGDPGCPGTYNGSYTWFEAAILRPQHNDATTTPTPTTPTPTTPPTFPTSAVLSHPSDFVDTLHSQGYDLVGHDGKRLWRVQANVCAEREDKEHEVVWRAGERCVAVDGAGDGSGFVDALRPGDRVCVFARALYPGWSNHVNAMSLEVGYKV